MGSERVNCGSKLLRIDCRIAWTVTINKNSFFPSTLEKLNRIASSRKSVFRKNFLQIKHTCPAFRESLASSFSFLFRKHFPVFAVKSLFKLWSHLPHNPFVLSSRLMRLNCRYLHNAISSEPFLVFKSNVRSHRKVKLKQRLSSKVIVYVIAIAWI